MGDVDVEARVRRVLREVADRVGDPVDRGARTVSEVASEGPARRRGASRVGWLVAVAAVVVVVAGVGLAWRVTRHAEVAMEPDPTTRPLVVTEGGVTVTARVVVGGGERCLEVSAVDAGGGIPVVADRGNARACLDVDAPDEVVAASSTLAGHQMEVVVALAGDAYRSIGAVVSGPVAVGPDGSDALDGIGPAVLLVIPAPPGSEGLTGGTIVAERASGGRSDPVPFGHGASRP